MSEDVYAHNPIYSGSHVQLKTRGTPDYDTVRFLLTYYRYVRHTASQRRTVCKLCYEGLLVHGPKLWSRAS